MDIILILIMKIYTPSSYINYDMKIKNCIYFNLFLIVSLFMNYYVILSLLLKELGAIEILKKKKQVYLWKAIYC